MKCTLERAMLALLLLFAAAAARADERHAQTASARPNIVLIISDDQGWNDIGYHGSEVLTPQLDRLAAGGVRLDRHYVFPTCSPTRAALLTGRYPSRYGILGPIGGRSELAIPKETVTLASILQKSGYDTAICGKWHLGLRPEVGPRQYGFSQSYGYLHGQLDQYKHIYKNGDRTWHRNDEFIDEEGHATDLIAADAVRVIETRRDRPFFLWVAFSVPHYPVQEEQHWKDKYQGKIENASRRDYAASITHMDDAIGKIVAALDRTGQRENTLLVFTSDNGGQQSWNSTTDYEGKLGPNPVLGNNEPLRGWKGSLYEGGVRVPAFASWPGKLKPGKLAAPIGTVDWLPTFLHLAGIPTEKEWQLDGQNVWPLVAGQRSGHAEPRTLYWKVPGRQGVLQGDWKLIVPRDNPDKVELFHLGEDPLEKNDRAKDQPQRVAQLRTQLQSIAAQDK